VKTFRKLLIKTPYVKAGLRANAELGGKSREKQKKGGGGWTEKMENDYVAISRDTFSKRGNQPKKECWDKIRRGRKKKMAKHISGPNVKRRAACRAERMNGKKKIGRKITNTKRETITEGGRKTKSGTSTVAKVKNWLLKNKRSGPVGEKEVREKMVSLGSGFEKTGDWEGQRGAKGLTCKKDHSKRFQHGGSVRARGGGGKKNYT